ncbi:MAG: NDP-sugar synthase [Deltaproteobacteria bacterium]|nr:NDP-sugar synthase [Deltaproteobacteria bacterium]
MEAMILAAGEGTRLLPLTRHKPKPLFPVLNLPLLALNLDYLRRRHFNRVIVNTHHLGRQIGAFLETYAGENPEMEIEPRPETEILGTGGGLKNTADFWREESFLVLNGDIVTDIDPGPALEFHRSHGEPATLILQDHPKFNNIVLSPEGDILKFRVPHGTRAFTGIHLLRRKILDRLPPVGFYDIIPQYQKLIDEGLPVRGYVSRNHYWRDMGNPESYRELHREILSGEFRPPLDFPCRKPDDARNWCIDPGAEIATGVRLEGWGSVGEHCRLGSGCRVRNSILWKGVRVGEGIFIENSIIADGFLIKENIINKIIC